MNDYRSLLRRLVEVWDYGFTSTDPATIGGLEEAELLAEFNRLIWRAREILNNAEVHDKRAGPDGPERGLVIKTMRLLCGYFRSLR